MMIRIIKYVTSLKWKSMLQVNWLKIVRALFLQCISALPKKNVAKRELIFGLLLHWSTFALKCFL